MSQLAFLIGREPESPVALLINSIVISSMVALLSMWNRRWKRQWQQARLRAWPTVPGKFDEGEVITMRKSRSGEMSGYQVWLGYEYGGAEELGGLYILPIKGEFETAEEAEERRDAMADQHILVRVSPRNRKRSGVLDENIRHLLPTRAAPAQARPAI